MPGNKKNVKNQNNARKQQITKAVTVALQKQRNPNRGKAKTRQQMVGPSRNAQNTRFATQGQNQKLNLYIVPDADNFQSLAAAFVMYGLTQGLSKALAGPCYMALQVMLLNAMENNPDPLKQAPRMWWALTNAVRPKTVKCKGQDFGYNWSLDSFGPSTTPNDNGWILGDQKSTATNGLYQIDTTPLAIPTLNDAAQMSNNLWTVFGNAHPLLPQGTVNDFIQDVSAFAFKLPLLENVNDPMVSAYAVCFLEVPIISYFGYMGLGTGSMTGSDGNAPGITTRIPRFSKFCQGAAGHHIGLRLCFPMLRQAKYVMTYPDLKTIDIGTWVYQDLAVRQQVNLQLASAGQSASPAGQLPPNYLQAPGVPANLFALIRIVNFIGSMLNTSPCWFGAWQNLAAMAVGTNLIDMYQYEGLTDSFVSIASVRELRPVYDKRRDVLTVPFPTISDAFLDIFGPLAEALGLTTGYGDASLDFLNSTSGGQTVCLVNGPTLKDDKLDFKFREGQYDNMCPNVSAVPSESSNKTKTVLTTKILDLNNPSGSKRILLNAVNMLVKDKKKVDTILELIAFRKKNRVTRKTALKPHRPMKVGEVVSIEEWREASKVKVSSRDSVDTFGASMIGSTSVVGFDSGRSLESVMQTPVSAYAPAPFGPLTTQLIHGDTSSMYPGNNAEQALIQYQFANSSSSVLAPNSTQRSDQANAMLKIVNSISSGNPDWSGVIQDVTSVLPPVVGASVRAVGALLPLVEAPFRGVQARRQKKGKKQLWRNIQ
jgi:hypothetical protein